MEAKRIQILFVIKPVSQFIYCFFISEYIFSRIFADPNKKIINNTLTRSCRVHSRITFIE